MTKEQILDSNTLKNRFIKDTKLPLSLIQNPYFEQRLQLYTVLYPDIIHKWDNYCEALSKYANEQDYLEYYGSVKDYIIDTVKGSEGYQKFNEEDMNKYAVPEKFKQLPSNSIFKISFDGKMFLSYDMRKANFSSMSYYDSSIFNNAKTWEKFLRSYTDCEHIINSKYIREASLGNCNPKRHITYEKYLMSLLLDKIVKKSTKFDILHYAVSFSNDEIVFDITDLSLDTVFDIRQLVDSCEAELFKDSPVHFKENYFQLKFLPDIDGYLEMSKIGGELTPKSINNFMMPFVCRSLRNEEVEEDDTIFVHPNAPMLCRFIEYPMITSDVMRLVNESR